MQTGGRAERSMAVQKDSGLVARAVREALGTLVSPELSGQLVARALKASRLDVIPESGTAVERWVEGPLRREIELSVGDDAAELVAAQLAPIIAHASGSAVRAQPKTEPPRASESDFASEEPTGVVAAVPPRAGGREELVRTARLKLSPEQLAQLRQPPPAETDEGHTTRPMALDAPTSTTRALPRVLAASADQGALAALRQALPDGATVVPVTDLVGLLDALDAPGLVEPVLLVDCRRPTVHVTSVLAIGEDLPRGTTVVLWGAGEETWRDLDRDRTPSCRWVRCSHEATTEDVGSLCAMLLG